MSAELLKEKGLQAKHLHKLVDKLNKASQAQAEAVLLVPRWVITFDFDIKH